MTPTEREFLIGEIALTGLVLVGIVLLVGDRVVRMVKGILP